ncbi:MAG: ABC transporter ATP-binding protein [Rhodobacteraceae bacterium]|jgi:putative hydroxymethylpyrimidine transport system ATP-binding protein|uniref:Putative hydroxymethylpyrimidine transport system ATP-binding protein n=1 Tax=Salipiger profundus TaxID=1229727 RepID=A0A1U7D856_9RHOB|nr:MULTISPECIES: ABC transporter ATP-binding protein [Salipiger]APX24354.1 putative hydroxymethylpyrimidine transport system ATP-binding protein [Salipiger profundus]MAB07342.1 ABC transporter ATP-binding protein [Paracoccaceae bacterium]GGA19345.1 ABC transporter [Salipiger profundus]SFD36246.1 putative hydroxymethylpyrimidine transport system ATP-binding protein [Salipiger profundus]
MTAPALHLSGRATIGDAPIFGPIEVTVPAGTWTCLLGPSGVGKSTVLRLLAGLGEEVSFDGTYGAGDGQPLAGRVGLMAQSDLLMPWRDIVSNVALGAPLRGQRPDRDRARALLARVGLADHADKRPHALSGGQRQRAALARTLMEDRPVVLLDEPFSALDARSRALMQELSAELLSGRTVLHVTHDTAEAARLGQRVLLMTGDGITEMPVPQDQPPRAYDAPETLTFQGRLHRHLMEAA